jgi:hypothetical protein
LFNGKEVQDLIFDEQPYKVYSAKVTGTPTLKTICFDDENGKRVYRGEGSVAFTCYYPFARTPDWVWSKDDDGNYIATEADGRLLESYKDYSNVDEWNDSAIPVLTNTTDVNRGEIEAPFVVEGAQGTVTVGDLTITIPEGVTATWDSMTGLVKDEATGKLVPVEGTSYGTIPTGSIKFEGTGTLKFKYWYY